MVLELSPQQLADISAHAEQVYPEECCGVMAGKIRRESGQTYKQICQLFPMQNKWTGNEEANKGADKGASKGIETKARRYSIAPEDMLKVQKQARAQRLSILGIYHSHPDHDAVPSECDRTLAWPEYAYTIVSVRNGKAVDIQNWALDSEHQFRSEAIAQSIPASAPTSSKASGKDRMPISA